MKGRKVERVAAMTTYTLDATSAATAWRARWPGHDAGIVLVWNGEGYGWKNTLRDATHERPGVLAVDALGNVYRAEGGND